MDDDARPQHLNWEEWIEAVDASTARVRTSVASLSEDQLREPSVLPGWTRAHIAAHLALNADALNNLVTWATTGVETPAYVSNDARAADIEAAATGSRDQLLTAFDASCARLHDGLASLDEEARTARVKLRDGAPLEAHSLPSVRLRELEIHHVDLLAGYSPSDWPADFVARTLHQLAPVFAAREGIGVHELIADDGATWTVGHEGEPNLHGSRVDLLVWLIGRDLPVRLRTDPSSGGAPPSPQW